MRNKNTLGTLLLLLTAMIWGTAFVAQRTGMDRIEPATFNSARMFLAAVPAGAVWFVFSRRSPRSKSFQSQPGRLETLAGGTCCGCFLAAASLSQQAGLVHTAAGKAGFITSMYLLLVPVIQSLIFKKSQPRTVWLAVFIALFGMGLLCLSGEFRLSRGDALIALCALLFSGHILCCDHFSRRCDPVALSCVQFLTAGVISGILALVTEQPGVSKLLAAAVPILYCGLISGGVGYTLQMTAQRFTEPTVASLLMSLESVFAALAGALLLNERMSAREISGCAVIFTAVVLVQLPPRRGSSL